MNINLDNQNILLLIILALLVYNFKNNNVVLIGLMVVLIIYYSFYNVNNNTSVFYKGSYFPTRLNPNCRISKRDLIKPFHQESNLRNTMKRHQIDYRYPINDLTAPVIASHLTNYGYRFNNRCSGINSR